MRGRRRRASCKRRPSVRVVCDGSFFLAGLTHPRALLAPLAQCFCGSLRVSGGVRVVLHSRFVLARCRGAGHVLFWALSRLHLLDRRSSVWADCSLHVSPESWDNASSGIMVWLCPSSECQAPVSPNALCLPILRHAEQPVAK